MYTMFYSLLVGRYAVRGMITGRRLDRAKASAACCETESVLIMLPIDMKKLEGRGTSARVYGGVRLGKGQYPNVAPDPTIYCPKLLITPFGPAPYLMMLTEPLEVLEHSC